MAQRGNSKYYFEAGVGGTLGWMVYWLRSRTRNALSALERASRERDASYMTRPEEGLGVPYVGRRVVPSFVGS